MYADGPRPDRDPRPAAMARPRRSPCRPHPTASTLLPPAAAGWSTAPDGTAYWYPPGATRATQRIADHTSWVSAAATERDRLGARHRGARPAARGQRPGRRPLGAPRGPPRKGGTVLALAVNRSGTRAYSAGDDGTVTAWDLTDRDGFGAQIRTPQVAGVDPARLIVIGDPVLAGRTGDWVVPVQQWGGLGQRRARSSPSSSTPHPARRSAASGPASGRRWAGRDETASLSPDGRLVAITTMFSTAVIDVDQPPGRPPDHAARRAERDRDGRRDGTRRARTGRRRARGARTVAGCSSPRRERAGSSRAVPSSVVDTATWKRTEPGAAARRRDRRRRQPGRPHPRGRAYTDGDVVLADAGTYQVQHRLHVDGAVHAGRLLRRRHPARRGRDSRRLNVWDPRTGEPVLADRAVVRRRRHERALAAGHAHRRLRRRRRAGRALRHRRGGPARRQPSGLRRRRRRRRAHRHRA